MFGQEAGDKEDDGMGYLRVVLSRIVSSLHLCCHLWPYLDKDPLGTATIGSHVQDKITDVLTIISSADPLPSLFLEPVPIDARRRED